MPWIIIHRISVVSTGSPGGRQLPGGHGRGDVLGRGHQAGGVGQPLVEQPLGGVIGAAHHQDPVVLGVVEAPAQIGVAPAPDALPRVGRCRRRRRPWPARAARRGARRPRRPDRCGRRNAGRSTAASPRPRRRWPGWRGRPGRWSRSGCARRRRGSRRAAARPDHGGSGTVRTGASSARHVVVVTPPSYAPWDRGAIAAEPRLSGSGW